MRGMCPATATSTPPRNLGALLSLVRSEVVRALERDIAEHGIDLRYSQFMALKTLARTGPMSAGELARALDHDGGAMTRLLDQLEARGYLRRQPNEQDRRALRIELTRAGKTVCKQLSVCSDRVLAAAQGSLNANEQLQLHDYLQRVLHTLRTKAPI